MSLLYAICLVLALALLAYLLVSLLKPEWFA
jgi:K+-transporting ATPase KdpF subunit